VYFKIPTEDCPTATKLTGLGNTKNYSKWKVFEVLNECDFILSIQQSNSKIGKTKNLWTTEMGNPTGEEIGVPDFIVNKVRISVQLQLHLNSLREGVVSLETWI
jgi:hypothetical protein